MQGEDISQVLKCSPKRGLEATAEIEIWNFVYCLYSFSGMSGFS